MLQSVVSSLFILPPTPLHSHSQATGDFYTEQIAAPDDLKHLTDQHESMAFRRRGYEVSAPPLPLTYLSLVRLIRIESLRE